MTGNGKRGLTLKSGLIPLIPLGLKGSKGKKELKSMDSGASLTDFNS